MQMKTQIKKCTIADLSDLQKISIETFTDTFGAENTEKDLQDYLTKNYDLEKLTRELQHPQSDFYFIFVQEQLAGYLKINSGDAQTESIAENALEIERIYVRRSFKGQGLGKALMEHAIKIAIQRQKTVIWLGVWEFNQPAIAFYQKRGFVKTGTHSFFLGQDEQTDWIMEKIIKEEIQ